MKVILKIDSKISFNWKKLKDKACVKYLKDEFKHTNPVFIRNQRIGIPNDNEPEEYFSFEIKKSRIYFSRGCLKKLKKILKMFGHTSKIKDRRVEGDKAEFNSKVKLRKEQEPAVEAGQVKQQGIIIAPPSAGKSVMGLELIARVGKVGMVVVWNKDHQKQWIEEAQRSDLLNLSPEEIGGVGGKFSKRKLGKLNVCMQQSLWNEDHREFFFSHCGVLVADECLDGETLIATPSGHKPIKEIKVGDFVTTSDGGKTRVTDVWETEKQSYKYKTKYGQDLITSDSHVVSTMVSNEKVFRPSNKSSRYENRKIKDAKNLRPFTSSKKKIVITKNILLGWIIADAHFSDGFFKFGMRKEDKINTLKVLLKECNINFKYFKNTRGDTVISIPVKESRHLKECLSFDVKNKSKSVTIPETLFKKCDVGILRGLFDADGCFTNNYIELDSISQRLIEQVCQMLGSLGVPSKVNKVEKANKKHSTVYRLCVTGKAVEYFHYVIGSDRLERNEKVFQFIQNKKPFRNSWKHNEIVGVEKLNKRKLYDITLSDSKRLFIANGYVVHNCQRYAANTFNAVINDSPAKVRIGLTADEKRKDAKHFLIHDAFGERIHVVQDNNIGSRKKARINLVPTNYTNDSYEFNKRTPELLNDMARDKSRNKIIIKRTLQKTSKKKLVLILLERKFQALYLKEKLESENLRVKLLVGKFTKSDIEDADDWKPSWKKFASSYDDDKEFFEIKRLGANKEIDVVIATQKGDVGLSIKTVDHVIISTPTGGNLERFNQQKGRAERDYDDELRKKFGKKATPSVDYLWDIKIESIRKKGNSILKNYTNVSVLQKRSRKNVK